MVDIVPANESRPSIALKPLILILLAVVVVCSPKFLNGYVWDDWASIVRSDAYTTWNNVPEFFRHHTLWVTDTDTGQVGAVDTYRPVTLVTFVWDTTIWHSPPMYHLTNLLMHLLAVSLVYLLAHRLLPPERWGWCWFAAAWFGLHPLLAEAHIWINGRSDPMAAIFLMAAVLAWRSALDKRRAWQFVASGVLFLTATLCKEVALLAAPAIYFWPDNKLQSVPVHAQIWPRLRNATPFVAGGVAYLLLRLKVLGGMAAGEGSGGLASMAKLPVLLADSVAELLVPRSMWLRCLRDDYLGVDSSIAILIVVSCVAFGGWLVWRRHQLGVWCTLWFVGTLAPVAVLTSVMWPGFGRYLYIPAIPIAVVLANALGALAESLPAYKRTLRFAAGAWCVALGASLLAVIPTYKNDQALFTNVIESVPEQAHGYGLLGLTEFLDGEYELAIPLLAEAVQRDPTHYGYLIGLVRSLDSVGNASAALDVALVGLQSFPHSDTLRSMTAWYLSDADPEEAARQLRACLEVLPDSVDCLRVRSVLVFDHPLRDFYGPALEGLDPAGN